MSVTYTVQITDPYGVPVGPIVTTDGTIGDPNALAALSYSRVTNDTGVAVLRYAGELSARLLRLDNLVLIYRSINGVTTLVTDTAWMIRSWRFTLDGSGQRSTEIIAYSGNYLLSSRGVAYQTRSAQSTKSGAADNLIKEVVRENLGSSATDTARTIAGISVQADTGQGQSIDVVVGWRNSVLTVAQELADASTDAGTYIAFDLVTTTPGQWEFRTFANQRGVDRRVPGGTLPLLLGTDYGNLADVEYVADYSDLGTAAYALGDGAGSRRRVQTATNDPAIALSPYNRREVYVEANNATTANQVLRAARSALRRQRARVTMQGRIVETPSTRYGIDWQWGDYVTATAFGVTLNARIDAISVSIESGRETVDAWVRSD